MRSGFPALCCVLLFSSWLHGQTAPTFTAQPSALSVFVGDAATLSATVDGTAPITLQWFKNTLAISGATNTSYAITAAALADTGVYHLVATNSQGSAQSQPVGLFVYRRAQSIAFNPSATTAAAGSGISLNATASSGLAITYTLVSGAATISGNQLIGTGGSVVVRASQAGNATFEPAESVEFTFTFIAGGLSPFVSSPPLSQTVNAGSTVIFTAAALGNPAPTYQWLKDNTPLAGATQPALALDAVTLSDTGNYTVVVTNLLGSARASATLTVRAAPAIVTAPASQQIPAGQRASFTVAATGFPAPTYQWRKDGTPVAGATGATLTLAAATAADAGRYEVVVTNALGSATSAPATLTVSARDFRGIYFGQGAGSDTASLLVRADRTGVLVVHLASSSAAAVANVTLDLNGTLSGSGISLGASPRSYTVRGTVNDSTHTFILDVLGQSFSGTRELAGGVTDDLAGYYQGAAVGTAAGRLEAVLGPNGGGRLLAINGASIEAVAGTLSPTGRFTVSAPSGAGADLQFGTGLLRGTLRTSTGATVPVLGAIDGLAGTQHLANLSIRSTTSPGAATLITGFVIAGSTAKQVLIRASGPTLAQPPFNVPGVLADPTLQVLRGNTTVAQNDDWGTPAANLAALTAATTRAGAFPFRAGSGDAALVTTLAPGAYSVVIGGGTGTTLAEIYEVLQTNEANGSRRLANLSARGLVTPTAPFVAGFVIAGPAPQRVLLRGVGPTLGSAPFNVAGALPNPQLTLFRGTTAVKTNDDWFRDPDATFIRDAAQASGAFALGANSLDAAVLLYLEPGAYTVQIAAPANATPQASTGLALIEVYEVAP